MPFTPPKPSSKIPVAEKEQVLRTYIEYYRQAAKNAPESLRVKLKRSHLQPFLDEIGEHLARLASEIGGKNVPESHHGKAVRKFLEDNPIPGDMGKYLTLELRAYALLVHGLHQWAVGQSLTADRWVISGNARDTLRACTDRCVVTDEPFGDNLIELHHPGRDGRPPIPVSEKGHKIADDVFDPQDEKGKMLVAVRRRLRFGWRVIWQGCLVELGETVDLSGYKNPKGRRSAVATRARRFSKESSTTIEEIRKWIEENDLVPAVGD